MTTRYATSTTSSGIIIGSAIKGANLARAVVTVSGAIAIKGENTAVDTSKFLVPEFVNGELVLKNAEGVKITQ